MQELDSRTGVYCSGSPENVVPYIRVHMKTRAQMSMRLLYINGRLRLKIREPFRSRDCMLTLLFVDLFGALAARSSFYHCVTSSQGRLQGTRDMVRPRY